MDDHNNFCYDRNRRIVVHESNKLNNSGDFQRWFGKITDFFHRENLNDVATGKDVLDVSKSKQDQVEWKKKDAEVQKAITSSVNKKLLIHLVYCTSGAEMFNKLQTIFDRNVMETDDLLGKFFKLEYDTKTGYKMYFRSLDRIVSKLNIRGITISEELVINKVLVSLPECYQDFREKWEDLDVEEKTLDELKKILIVGDEWHEKVRPVKACCLCGNPYHNERYCLKMYANRKAGAHLDNGHLKFSKFTFFQSAAAWKRSAFPTTMRPRCKICKKDNHATRNCYFRPKRVHRDSDHQEAISLSFDEPEGRFVITEISPPADNSSDQDDSDDDDGIEPLVMF